MNDNVSKYSEFSYEYIKNIRGNFRKILPDKSRIYDEPGFFFWKPIFYFYNGDGDNYSGLGSAGLLHPSWINNDKYSKVEDTSNEPNSPSLQEDPKVQEDIKKPNSAYNYLLRNDEIKRAKLLKNFVELLSDINSNTPWYFKEISGLEEALSRNEFFKSPKINEDRKKIVITCLADSVDTRIGNMLDMYRAACFSWQTKREIVPANLRKFDMGIYIFLQPSQMSYHGNIKTMSHKYLEFHNCEIDIDSCKISDTFSSETAQSMEYKISIYYDNCYDNRYSNNVLGMIGDAIRTDMVSKDDMMKDADGFSDMYSENAHKDNTSAEYGDMYNPKLTNRNNIKPNKSVGIKDAYGNMQGKKLTGRDNGTGFLSNLTGNIIDATVGNLKQTLRSGVGSLLLGNLYHGSLTRGLQDVMQGRIISGGTEILQTATSEKTYINAGEKALGTLYSAVADKTKSKVKQLEKLNKSRSLLNNI